MMSFLIQNIISCLTYSITGWSRGKYERRVSMWKISKKSLLMESCCRHVLISNMILDISPRVSTSDFIMKLTISDWWVRTISNRSSRLLCRCDEYQELVRWCVIFCVNIVFFSPMKSTIFLISNVKRIIWIYQLLFFLPLNIDCSLIYRFKEKYIGRHQS